LSKHLKTALPMGGGKVELILTKKGKSDNEMRFLSKFHDRIICHYRKNRCSSNVLLEEEK
jgi:glutamate dehydrogenase/leucine dehydrogenase